MIGNGSFGTVRLATLRLEKNKSLDESRKFAIKTVPRQKVKDKDHLLKRELEILKTLDHPNIVKFYEIYCDDMYFHYVMEYCSGGDLLSYVSSKEYLTEEEAAKIMYKLLSAVNHMHSKHVIHRDIKPENIMMSTKEEKTQEVKIIDFGLSRIYNKQVYGNKN